MKYTSKVLKLFKNPKYVGEIKNADGLGKVGNPSCGDEMHVYIKVRNNKIKKIMYKTFGCVAAIASSESMCELAKGKTLEQASKINAKEITKNLGELPPIKFHCSVLGHEALKRAIKDYKKKSK